MTHGTSVGELIEQVQILEARVRELETLLARARQQASAAERRAALLEDVRRGDVRRMVFGRRLPI